MVLNTSFNLKNQPIVEGPEEAIRALLASEGRLAALFIGLFEVTLRPFPFSDLEAIAAQSGIRQQGDKDGQGPSTGTQALLEGELAVVVRAKKFYMLEMVSSSGGSAGTGTDAKPLRIRIQGTFYLCCYDVITSALKCLSNIIPVCASDSPFACSLHCRLSLQHESIMRHQHTTWATVALRI